MKKIALLIMLVGLATVLIACGTSKDEPIYGTWQLYGVIEQDTDYQNDFSEDDIITGKTFQENFGTDVPDSTITITKDGVKEIIDTEDNGFKIKSWKKHNDHKWVLTMEVTELADEKPLDKPIKINWIFTLKDSYLLIEEKENNLGEYGSGIVSENTNVYTKIE